MKRLIALATLVAVLTAALPDSAQARGAHHHARHHRHHHVARHRR